MSESKILEEYLKLLYPGNSVNYEKLKDVIPKSVIDCVYNFGDLNSELWQSWFNNQIFPAIQNKDNTLGVIHIVRDPRNIITSVMHYFNKKSYEETLEFLQDTNNILGGNKHDNGIPTLLSSWSNHYNSWKSIKKNYLLIKYENLILNPENEFTKITKYLFLPLRKPL